CAREEVSATKNNAFDFW
nr:immunoglobulin heavy chain junction region [Macaca mulatta]MOW21060.1 immunoglobulin heavy chain junction region [Macaca mulatta]MOW21588.1 immunoglobulin heavy chain junction region [Macaca mulatta]MOW21908.1 immunoglobulin heavy chain junction region [Macaca mulatta]MOW22337.1 immunoglobulin heavy chain junction region [Macaca mulatta]